ncbi:dihydrolipoamide acetyltransferase family protein [Enhygromyxa salina]|uniref:Dihydrolipoamide acetyltransferase component of pyruvate dehydrogenase complex n=1 Tax=Enhygromyxa salina TaxID=215803 RepID=A0A2S9YRH9_9BACT|nr:dihydrolipoamide acetyltransferase family protein [Enhygromyxa salina]PRQ07669.1 Dihydrolipoyllysine-residue acetyltransferase component of pyruvate dehydrogenase complex [Enhygromyxa salina]
MATIVELPRLSDTMEEGVVAKWRVAVGDKVKRGQIIAEIETDKATMEFESFDSGYVLALVAEEGEALPLGAPIAVFGKEGEDPQAALASASSGGPAPAERAAAEAKADERAHAEAPEPSGDEAEASEAPAPDAAPKRESAPAAAERVSLDADSQRIPASPIARRLAREHDLELTAIAGSGPHGRVIKADVERAAAEGTAKRGAAASPAAGSAPGTLSTESDAWGRPYVSRPDEHVRLNQMRKAIARRMTQSKQEVPHYYLTLEVDMGRAIGFRADYNAAIAPAKISFNDLIVKAVARALREFPAVNVSFAGAEFIRRGDVHVGVAVAVDDGLIVPVIRFADQKSLESISSESRDLGGRARSKQLRPEEMSGGTFTVSNLGMFGIQEFAAVINPGEPGILAVGAIEPRAVVVDGQVAVRQRMTMTISADHRVTDGALAAQWLNLVKGYLENPLSMLADPK